MASPPGKSGRLGLIFIAPAFLYLVAITIVPTIMLVRYAFSSWEIADIRPIDFVGFETFRAVLSNPITLDNFRATFVFVFSAVLIELVLGMAIALVLARSFRGATLIRTLMIAPVITVPIGAGYIWRYILHPDYGVLNWFMEVLHLPYIQWLGAKPWSMWAIVIADVWQWTPFVMLILLAGLVSIPQTLYEAAKIDGASKLQLFWFITLPLMGPTIAIAVVLRLIWAMKSFDTIFAMTRGGPGTYTSILNYEIFKQAFFQFHTAYAAAMGVIVLIITVIITRSFLYFSK